MNWKNPLSWKVSGFFLFLLAVCLWVVWEGKGPQGEFPRVLFLAVALAFLAAALFALGRILVQPLNDMIGVVEKYAAGLFNWRVRLGTRNDTLGHLGNQLNRMA